MDRGNTCTFGKPRLETKNGGRRAGRMVPRCSMFLSKPYSKVSSICNRVGKRGSKERADAKYDAHAAEIT